MGPGSAEQREERCTASGTREYCFTSSQDEVQTLMVRSASSRVSNHEANEVELALRHQCFAALLAAALLRTIRPSTATPVLVLIRNGLTSIDAMRAPASAIRLESPTMAFTAEASCSAGLPR